MTNRPPKLDDRILSVFRNLHELITSGYSFKKIEVDLMEKYLEIALAATKKMKAKGPADENHKDRT